jgi:hypothetical protein
LFGLKNGTKIKLEIYGQKMAKIEKKTKTNGK